MWRGGSNALKIGGIGEYVFYLAQQVRLKLKEGREKVTRRAE